MTKVSLQRMSLERRRDPRRSEGYSLENWLRWNSYRLGARALVVADSWGRVLAEYGAGMLANEMAMMPGDEAFYSPSQVQASLFHPEAYIKRVEGPNMTKIWPFRFAQGVGYLVCVMQHPKGIWHAELEAVCAGFRRIFGEEFLAQAA